MKKIIPYLHILIMLCIASITVYSTLDCIRLFSHITDVKNSCVEFLWRGLLSDYYRGVGSPLTSKKELLIKMGK